MAGVLKTNMWHKNPCLGISRPEIVGLRAFQGVDILMQVAENKGIMNNITKDTDGNEYAEKYELI